MYHFERKKWYKTIKAAKLCSKAYLAAFVILLNAILILQGYLLRYQAIQFQTSIQN